MLTRRLRYWFGKGRREASLRAEMEQHLAERAAELRDSGLSDSDSMAEARRQFGNLGLKLEDSREIWIARYWSDFWRDLWLGLRSLGRDPGLAAVAILSAALGIGACSTIFRIVNFAVFRPLPVAEPERLMALSAIRQKGGTAGQTLSFPEIRDLRSGARSWQGVAAFAPLLTAGVRADGGEARQYSGFLVTANYFDVVKSTFIAGGGFVDQEDDVPGAPAKIVLTHGLWVSQFGADASIIGRTIQVNKRAMTVVGVTDPGFRGTAAGVAADFFLPFSQLGEMRRLGADPRRMTNYGARWLMGLGRMRPEVDARQVQADLDIVAHSIREHLPMPAPEGAFHAERAGQLLPGMRTQALRAILLLFAMTVLVLLVACANIANLMLARASARGKEIATRLAIGASRGRLIRQLMTESALLAAGGGLLGVGLASWASWEIARLRLPIPAPMDTTLPIDYRVLLFSAALSVITGLAFGLIPALRATRPNLTGRMRSNGGPRNALVVGQVAMSATLVICSGLFLRTLDAARGIDTGMDTRDLTLVRFDPALNRYDEPQTRLLLLEVLRGIEALPGVRSASVTNLLPLSNGGNFTEVAAAGTAGDRQSTAVVAIGPNYFQTMGIRLLSGLEFDSAPSKEATVIVNQELARKLFPDQNAVDQSISYDGGRARIVGLAANSKHEVMMRAEATPILYRPILDSYAGRRSVAGLTLLVRSTQDPGPLGNAVRRLLLGRDPELVVSLSGTMDSHVEDSLFMPRLMAFLFGLCGGMGLFIASIGVYGVANFAVARRTREIGIRMALGARSRDVMGMVLWQGTVLAVTGIAIGTAGGFGLARAGKSFLYGVSETDPLTFVAVPVILLFVTLLASAIPARRAATVDPNRALRAE